MFSKDLTLVQELETLSRHITYTIGDLIFSEKSPRYTIVTSISLEGINLVHHNFTNTRICLAKMNAKFPLGTFKQKGFVEFFPNS